MADTHILVIADEGTVARNIPLELSGLGYVVAAVASSGAEALEKVGSLRPDLVLIDADLKGDIGGIETGRQLRQRHGLPVVYLAASADDEALRRAAATDPYGYLIQPCAASELHATIQLALHRHKRERLWKEAHHWLTSLIECIDDAVVIADATGRIGMVNAGAESLTGWPRAEAVGRELLDVCDFIDQETRRPLGIPTVRAVREGRAVRLDEAALLRGRAGEIPVAGWVAAVRDGGDNLSGFLVVFRQRMRRPRPERESARATASFQLAPAVEAPDLPADELPHDLSRLLTGIVGGVSLVASQLPPETPERKCLRAVEQAASLAGEIVGRSTDLFTTVSPHFERVDLNKVVAEVVETLCCLLSPRIALEFLPAPDLGSVQADALLLNEVVLDLCMHAQDAMPYGGHLVLETENVGTLEAIGGKTTSEEGFVRLRVRDTGSGIPAAIRSRLVAPFFMADEPGGPDSDLAFVFGVVAQHGGWVDCSGGADEGTCFEIYLPRREAKRAAPLQPTGGLVAQLS